MEQHFLPSKQQLRGFMIVINKQQVQQGLSMSQAIELIEKAMCKVSDGSSILPLRWGMAMPEGGFMGMMPGYIADPDCFGIKIVNIMPDNAGSKLSSHLGCMLLFDAKTGVPLALIDAGEITAFRTAAASAVATDKLARRDSKVLALVGSGEQARAHLQALMLVRDFEEIRVQAWQRDEAERFAVEMRLQHNLNVKVEDTVKEALNGACVVCTVTSSPDPIVTADMLQPGMHLNVVGASIPERQEITNCVVSASRYYVDFKTSAFNQAGELIRSVEQGLITPNHVVGEIGEVLNGDVHGRESNHEVTLYRSLGVAAQDLVVANHLYLQALNGGPGSKIDFYSEAGHEDQS
ncbi:MAG: ornithine cyclodeaminase family protein [Kordiimonas sp.]